MTIGNIDHKAAAGIPLEIPAPVQSEDWTTVEGWEQAGIEARWKGSKKWYRAVARIDDPRYQGEVEAVGKEYRACDEADPAPVTGYVINPISAQHQNDIAAAIARSHMDPAKDAAMSDMRRHLKTLENDLLFPYNQWMQRNARHLEQVQRTALIREQVALMVADMEEFGMEPEYTQFIEQLQTLLKGNKNSA